MASIGQFPIFRIGDRVVVTGKPSVYTVVAVVGWRECVLTMEDTDATLFTDQIRAKVGDNGIRTYQKVCVMTEGAVAWHEGFKLERAYEQDEVRSVEAEGRGASGSDEAGSRRG